MQRYRSGGAATIAALMAADRPRTDCSAAAKMIFDIDHDFGEIARRCERAVVTAYRDLRGLGTDDLAAFLACTTLYRIHHPDASLDEARRLVAEWIDHHLVRGEDGPTPGCDCG